MYPILSPGVPFEIRQRPGRAGGTIGPPMTRPATCAAVVLAAAFAAPVRAQNADFVWYGGSILSAGGARPEALAVKDGRIAALGTRAEVERKWKGRLTLPIDLNGQALVAGIVAPEAASSKPAARSVPVKKVRKSALRTRAPQRTPPPPGPPRGLAPPVTALAADVSPPGAGLPYSISSLRDTLRAWILRSNLPRRHGIVLGFGYDEMKLQEGRPPTREELDRVSATLPVIVVSKTGSAGAYNTIALQRAGISWRTKDPPGGTIRRRGRIHEPNGVLEGSAHAAAFARLVPRLDDAERWRLHDESVRLNTLEEPEAVHTAAAVAPTPEPAPAPAPTPTPAPAVALVSLPLPPDPRDAGSEALTALVADVLAGRAVLEAGRPADMSVLSDDPSSANPARRAAIKVVEEVRKGRTVWRRDPTRR